MIIQCQTKYETGDCNMSVDLNHMENLKLTTGQDYKIVLVGYCEKCGQGYYKDTKPMIEVK